MAPVPEKPRSLKLFKSPAAADHPQAPTTAKAKTPAPAAADAAPATDAANPASAIPAALAGEAAMIEIDPAAEPEAFGRSIFKTTKWWTRPRTDSQPGSP